MKRNTEIEWYLRDLTYSILYCGTGKICCSWFLGLFCSVIPFSHAVKPMKKTVDRGLFFFFIHILVCFWLKYSSKAYPWMRMLKVEREGGGRGDIFPQTFPPPKLSLYCRMGRQPWPAWLGPPPPPATHYPRYSDRMWRQKGGVGSNLAWLLKRLSFPYDLLLKWKVYSI